MSRVGAREKQGREESRAEIPADSESERASQTTLLHTRTGREGDSSTGVIKMIDQTKKKATCSTSHQRRGDTTMSRGIILA